MAWAPEEAAVQRAIAEPPRSTRACIRGRCIQKFSDQVLSAQWDHITLQGSRRPLKISLLNLFTPKELAVARAAVEAARQPDDLAAIAEPADE
jgi:proteasome accessory factor A